MRIWGRVRMGQSVLKLLVVGAVTVATQVAGIGQAGFPLDREMLLEARPLPGSRRVPILEIGVDGRAQVDLWCRSGTAQVEVAGANIRFTLGPLRDQACTPERVQRDEAMAATLAQVTQWRLDQEVLVLVGPTELRFHLSSH